MKMKSEKGYTGIDMAISVVVIFIFVSLIAILSYQMNSYSKEIELKSEATSLAIDEIEKIKNMTFGDIESKDFPTEEIKTGFFRTVTIIDYNEINNDKKPGFVKQITVEIKYMFKGNEQKVELSTIMSKET